MIAYVVIAPSQMNTASISGIHVTLTRPKSPAWHLIYTKVKREFYARDQLENQNYRCFLPTLNISDMHTDKPRCEPLFSRYLFVYINEETDNWASIRSTRGVVDIVRIGGRFATLADPLVDALREQSASLCKTSFENGERVKVKQGMLAGLEGVFQMTDGHARALVLVELLGRPQKLHFKTEQITNAL